MEGTPLSTIDGRDGDVYQARWRMLALLVLGYVSLTLNWFNIASAFTPISEDLGVSFEQLAMLIALFVLGYGVAHVPGGIIAARLGMKRTLVLGWCSKGPVRRCPASRSASSTSPCTE